MNLTTLVYALALGVLAALAVANWSLLAGPVDLDLLFTSVSIPAAILCVALVGLVFLADFTVHMLMRTRWDRERRVLSAQLEDLHERASDAGTARQVALHELIVRETASIRQKLDDLRLQGRPVPRLEGP